jgi:nucleoside-diphosphate-sugar epimerase
MGTETRIGLSHEPFALDGGPGAAVSTRHVAMRVLIIGCGYVGLPLAMELARQGHQVWGLRRGPYVEHELKAAGITSLAGDITKPETLSALPGAYDWVVNCVSSSGGGEADYREVYLKGTQNLIEWLSPRPPRKFVYTSSTSVYGQTDGSTVDEASLAEPESPTAKILVEAENVLLTAATDRKFPAVILRVAGIYGPGRGYWFKQFLRKEAAIEGRGERLMNMIHRDDVVGAVLNALLHGRAGEIYNAVDNEPVSQISYFRWLSEMLDQPLPPFVPEDLNAARKRALTNKKVSNRRLKTELDYEFKYPTFREGYRAEIQRKVHP